MSKWVSNDVLDASWDKVATATIMTLCTEQPTTRTEAITTFMLADVTMVAGDGNGDYTILDGLTSGRRLLVTEQAGEAVTNDGTGTHVAFCDGSGLLYVTTCTDLIVVNTGTVDFPAFNLEILDPA
jgi:hypothetical protein